MKKAFPLLVFAVLGFSLFAESFYKGDRIYAFHSLSYTINLTAGTRAEVQLKGDGDTDLDLYVYDSNGSLFAYDEHYTDSAYVTWTAGSTGSYRIEIRNLGSIYNQFQLWINTSSPAEASAASLRTSGDAHRDAGRYDAAIADYTEAIRLAPNNAVYYSQRGLAYHDKGEWDRAIADYTQAIRLDSNNTYKATYYGNRARAYNEKRDYDRAIADATEAIRLNSNSANPYAHRANAYFQKGNYTQARADVNRCLSINANQERAKNLDAELKRRGY